LLELIQQSNDPELKKAESVEQAVLYVMAKGIYDERAFGGAEIYKNASKKYAVEKVNLPIKQEGITVVKIPNALWQIRELDFSERKKPKSIDTNLMVTLVAVTEEGTRVIQGENDQSGFVHFKIPPGTTKVLTVVRADNPNEKNQNSGALDLVINN